MHAFKQNLHDGFSLRIRALVRSPFKSDFDGATMVMNLTLSNQSQPELQDPMSPSRNFNCAAHKSLLLESTQDMVFDIYYLTAYPPSDNNEVVDLSRLQAVFDVFQTDI